MSQRFYVSQANDHLLPERYERVRSERIFTSKPSEQRLSFTRYLGIIEEPAASFNRRMHMPDSHPGLAFNFGAPLLTETGDGKQVELPRVFFGSVSIQKARFRVWATGTCRYVGVDMHAWGTRYVIGDQVDLMATPVVPLGGVWEDFAQTLEATFQRQGEAEGLALLDQFVADLQPPKQFDVAMVRTALDALYATDGQFNLHELAARCSLSPSQLERQFKYYIGVTPKTFARAVRLDAITAALLSAPARQMTHLAQRFGYTDQAHFIHEFKTFMNCTPSEFLASRSA
ncbi:MAG TPA: helix-turn-helix domain-containing protein [Phototrophicaceae bacterium]|nr:helix-turn-helix domain-containing protein [Phototrophicaceae bacterium]